MQEVIDRRPKVKGIRMAREILPLLRVGVDSPQESRLRLKIVDAGLPEPAVTQPVFDEQGRYVSTPDLQYKEYKIAMEYEGDHHRSDPVQWGKDIERDDRLRAMGWIVLKFSDVQMKGGWANAERKVQRCVGVARVARTGVVESASGAGFVGPGVQGMGLAMGAERASQRRGVFVGPGVQGCWGSATRVQSGPRNAGGGFVGPGVQGSWGWFWVQSGPRNAGGGKTQNRGGNETR